MARTFKNFVEAKRWFDQYDPLAPKAGDEAPDFELCDTNGENPVRLSSFRGERPVALVFGSFT
jgi:peroxiredoxin